MITFNTDYQTVETFSCAIMTLDIIKYKEDYFISRNGGIRTADYKPYSSLEEARKGLIELLQNTRKQIEEYIESNV